VSTFIETRGLTHLYPLGDGGQIVALRNVSLCIEPGEFVALIGANGSGKSTLARHFNALLLPTEGQVLVDGLSTLERENLWEIRRRVGMVFQNPENQLVASTVEEDVAFGPENWALPRPEIRTRVAEALNAVGLWELRTRPPQMLSGGQKQLVAIAGALATRPDCIVFDEPTSMLDPRGRRIVLETVQQLNEDYGLTVILITQSMDEAAVAERILALAGGRIVLDGAPRDVFTREHLLSEMGLGLPASIQITALLRKHGVTLDRTSLNVRELAAALRTAAAPP
jgi:energy-coupling factor transport system ATP-binding protein